MSGAAQTGSTRPQLPQSVAAEVDRILAESSAPDEELARLCERRPEHETAILAYVDTSRVRTAGGGEAAAAAPIQRGVLVDGRYELDRCLGRGAMGEVWYAVDRRWDHRPHALKFLGESPLEAMQHAAMIAEANVLASLAHENIVAVRNVGQHGRRPFLAMDYLPGGSLQGFVDGRGRRGGGALTVEEAIWILAEVAPALDYAHQRGVVHRDLKPDNILLDAPVRGPLTQSGARARIADFGLALSKTAERAVGLAGTLPFLAPELLSTDGPDKAMLRRADIYALAGTIYALLFGEGPLGIPRTLAALEAAIAQPPERQRTGRAALDDALASALDFDPARRPASAGAMLAGLDGNRRVLGSTAIPSSAVAARPVLFLRQAAAAECGASLVLQVGVANPGKHPLTGRIFVEPLDARSVAVPTPDRPVDLGPGRAEFVVTTLLGSVPGRHVLRLRTVWRGGGAREPLHSLEGTVVVHVGASGSAYDAGPRPALAAPTEAMRARLARTAGCDPDDLLPVRLLPTRPAQGVAPLLAEHPRTAMLRLDVRERGTLHRRLHLRFASRARFGRVAEASGVRNDFVFLRLPCDSAGAHAENHHANTRISRVAGQILADERRSAVQADAANLVLDGAPVPVGSPRLLGLRTEQRLELGGLALLVTAVRAAAADGDVCRLLAPDPLASALASGPVEAEPRHRVVRIRRVGNLEHVEYALVCRWLSVGGTPEDDLIVPGLPSRVLLIAHEAGKVFALAGSGLVGPGGRSADGLWYPAAAGDVFQMGDVTLELASTSPEAMGLEVDVTAP